MFGSSKSWGLNSTHLHGTHVPVQEPSTASIADMCGAARDVRYGPIADIFSAPTIKGLSEACAIVSSEPFDLVVGQLRGDQTHAAIDVVAALPRRIERELLDEIFVTLLRQHGRLDGAAGTGPVTGRA